MAKPITSVAANADRWVFGSAPPILRLLSEIYGGGCSCWIARNDVIQCPRMRQMFRWILSLFSRRKRGDHNPPEPPPPLFPRSFQREENDRQDVPGLPYQSLELDEYGGIVSFVVRTPFFFTPEEITARDNAAIFASQQVKGQTNTTAQRATCGLNLFIKNGQSEAAGYQSDPAISLTQPLDVLMIGQSVRPINVVLGFGANMQNFTPLGDSNLHPAVSVNQGTAGTIVAENQGGFRGIAGGVFGINTFSVAAGTATMVTLVGETLVSTLVGGAGQPAFDFTQVFSNGELVVFYDEMGGPFSFLNSSPFFLSTPPAIIGVTPTTLTLGFVNFPVALPTTPTESLSIYRVNQNIGEEAGVAKVTMLRDLQLTRRSLTAATDQRKPVIANVSVGGVSIAAFAKSADPTLYNRSLSAAAILASNAVAANDTWCVVSQAFLQGGSERSTTGAVYLPQLTALATGQQADLMAASGQTKRPLFIVAQISGHNLPDYDNNGVAMAQLDFGRKPPNSDCYFYGPMYFVTDRRHMSNSPHWLPNGEIWAGSLEAKIDYKILEAGEGWQALHWLRIETRGTKILLTYHVPEPPLQFQQVFLGTTATSFPDKGFTISDAAGRVLLNSVHFPMRDDGNAASCLVEIDCARSFDRATLRIIYADATNHGGAGNLSDSCPWLSYASYRYTDFGGQMPNENIPAMVNKKFPLHNWACVQNELVREPGDK